MTEIREWARIAVVGAGAVGGYFGGTMALAGAPVVRIGRKQFADVVNERGLLRETTDLDLRRRRQGRLEDGR